MLLISLLLKVLFCLPEVNLELFCLTGEWSCLIVHPDGFLSCFDIIKQHEGGLVSLEALARVLVFLVLRLQFS